MERQVQRIQKVQLKPQVGPEDVDGSQLSSSWMQKGAREDPGRRIQ